MVGKEVRRLHVSDGYADYPLDNYGPLTAVLVYQLCWCGGSHSCPHQSGGCHWSHPVSETKYLLAVDSSLDHRNPRSHESRLFGCHSAWNFGKLFTTGVRRYGIYFMPTT